MAQGGATTQPIPAGQPTGGTGKGGAQQYSAGSGGPANNVGIPAGERYGGPTWNGAGYGSRAGMYSPTTPTGNPSFGTPPAPNTSGQPPNIFTQSAQGITNAMGGAQAGMSFDPLLIGSGGGGAFAGKSAVGEGYTSGGYKGAQVADPTGYASRQVNGMDLSGYTNPWETSVVNQSLSDIDRSRQMEQRMQQAQATSQGAFGGSRQALMNTENTRNYADQAARTASGLRQAGFENAQQMALQDINNQNRSTEFSQGQSLQAQLANQASKNQGRQFTAGAANDASAFGAGARNAASLANASNSTQAGIAAMNNNLQGQIANQNAIQNAANFRLNASNALAAQANMGFGMGKDTQDMSNTQGANMRSIQQALIEAGKGQWAGLTGQPYKDLSSQSGVISNTPTPQSQTSTSEPGLMDYATTAAMMYAAFAGSDVRLKDNVEHIGYYESGLKQYRWTWNETAKRIGVDTDPTIGVMAHEARELFPDAVIEAPDGYLRVDYRSIN